MSVAASQWSDKLLLLACQRVRGGTPPPLDIASALGRHPRTIERELARGRVKHVDSELRQDLVGTDASGTKISQIILNQRFTRPYVVTADVGCSKRQCSEALGQVEIESIHGIP